MIKHGLKSYFLNLKYFFMTIGTLSIGIVFGLSIFVEGSIRTASNLVEGVADVINRTSIDVNQIKEYLSNTILSLNWNEPFEALANLINLDFIKNVFEGLINLMSSDLAPYATELDILVNNAISAVVTNFVIMLSLIGLSMFCGYYLTRILIRKNMAKRNIWKMLLSVLIDVIISISLFLLCSYLTLLWTPSIIISVFIILLLFGAISLYKAYLLHARGETRLKQILNIKNILNLIATNILIFIFTLTFAYIVTLLTNIITGIYVGIGLFEIGLIVINLNAESYVINFVKLMQPKPVVTEDKPVVAEDKPVVTEDKPVVAEDKPVVTENKLVVTKDKPAKKEDTKRQNKKIQK